MRRAARSLTSVLSARVQCAVRTGSPVEVTGAVSTVWPIRARQSGSGASGAVPMESGIVNLISNVIVNTFAHITVFRRITVRYDTTYYVLLLDSFRYSAVPPPGQFQEFSVLDVFSGRIRRVQL